MASGISPGLLISGQRDVECDDTHRAGAIVKFVVNTVYHFDVSRLAHLPYRVWPPLLVASGRHRITGPMLVAWSTKALG